ncbi:sulfatase-like hydrolase/transferase, partial [Alienimonas sp. DA493]|uniref:sulfatase-like hydrolase/transferase n=1 Tax=Alienimonas sp. DA493 TaxID=3373605 RepID=UPI003754469E
MTAPLARPPAFPTRRASGRRSRRRRTALSFAAALVGGLLAAGTPASADGPPRPDGADEPRRPPNFLFVLVDDQGWTGTSVPMDGADPRSKSDYYLTPNLERLAREGTRFSRGYSPAPNCSPSRMAILTGKTPARLQFTDIVGRGHRTDLGGRQRLRPGGKGVRAIQPEEITLPELLKSLPDAGYRTAHFGKWHLGKQQPPGRHGFDVSDGPTGNREGSLGPRVGDDPKRAFSVTERANAFMTDAVESGRPFYCQVSHYAVHQAIQHRAASLAQAEARESGAVHDDPAYAAMTADLDDALGRLLTRLDELGVAENTYVVYQADNGSPHHLSVSPPLRRFKPEIWEGGVRVPTLVRGPGVPAGAQCDLPTSGA